MRKTCLNCGLQVWEIFEPCPECGMRPTDPTLRQGTGKEQYEREQGRHQFTLSLMNRRKSADGLERDLRKKVPMLYGSPWFGGRFGRHAGVRDPGIEIAKLHREAMVAKNGGGLPPGVGPTATPKLPYERKVIILFALFVMLDKIWRFIDW